MIRVKFAHEVVDVFQIHRRNSPAFRLVADVVKIEIRIVPFLFDDLADLFEQFRTRFDIFGRFLRFDPLDQPIRFERGRTERRGGEIVRLVAFHKRLAASVTERIDMTWIPRLSVFDDDAVFDPDHRTRILFQPGDGLRNGSDFLAAVDQFHGQFRLAAFGQRAAVERERDEFAVRFEGQRFCRQSAAGKGHPHLGTFLLGG